MLPSLAPELNTPARLPFIRKLRNFLEDHGLDGLPALVLQCDAQDARVADIASRPLQQAMLAGSGESGNADWWMGFMGGSTQQVFDGLATRGDRNEPSWVTELHEDGHVLASVLLNAYPDLNGVHPAIQNAFPQFGMLVQKLHTAAGIETKLNFTATLVNAKGLELLAFGQYGQPRRRKIGRDRLEWPVLPADGAEGVAQVCLKMRAQMQRIFP
jgi:hypothetical protein